MDMGFKERFMHLWAEYFNRTELPVTYFYTDETNHAELADPESVARCVMASITKVRNGESITLGEEAVHCEGARRFFGFTEDIGPGSDTFLSYGTPGQMEGERLKKTPEIVREFYDNYPPFKAPARYIVFKRWDMLEEADTPEVAVFFVKPDVLAGLYNLANYDITEPHGAIAPWGSGCSSIVQDAYLEKDSRNPRAVIGTFDITARLFVAAKELSFSVPLKKLVTMTENMEESFLITREWKSLQRRL